MSNILNEYFHYQDKYTKIYNKDFTIVFMRIGDFFEAYATNTRGFELSKISEITNLVKTKKNKNIELVDDKNPYMMGFQHQSLQKFLKILVDNNFTVIIVDQITLAPNPKRAVTGIYSAGTYINDTNSIESNNILSIYIEDEKQLNNSYLSCIGLSCIDLTTGECLVYEVFSTNEDDKYALDEAYRFILSSNPKEILICRKEAENLSITKDQLLSYLELENKNVKYTDHSKISKAFSKLNYQNEFFGKIYRDLGMLSPIEYIDMEKMMYSRLSLIILLDFVYKHNESFINNLNKPEIFTNSKHLILGNNAIYQLNILENNIQDTTNVKFKSLFNVINNTSTAMGRRFLKTNICQPLNDLTKIELRYNCVEELLDQDLYKTIEYNLQNILDIERLGKKIFYNSLHPFELANLIDSLDYIKKLYLDIAKTKFNSQFNKDDNLIILLEEFMDHCNKTYNITELRKQNMNDITDSFFNKKIYPMIDDLDNKITNNIEVMEQICDVLSNFIDNTVNKNKIILKRTGKEGYFLSLTKTRSDKLKKNISELEIIKISETLSINPKNIIFKETVPTKKGQFGNTKIYFTDLNTKSDDVIVLKDKLISLVKKKYEALLINYTTKYKNLFRDLSQFIANVDFIKSNAKTAKLYGYCRPKLIDNPNNGYINVKKMRHPIIERLRTDVEYIPHDIELGKYNNNTVDGILLFGLNSAGKTSIMKAIGLNLIMAQAGMFVAAESYEYSLYDSLFARITGNDNIFKGQSQFGLEMTELRAILKRNNPKTLVIGDEVCRGTENISGNCIVAATLIFLSESKCSFIFATHLHDIPKLDRIKKLTNVISLHLSLTYDEKNEALIFDRILKPGSGPDIYGLTVAKYIIKDKEFIDLANTIMNELLDKPDNLLSDKTSKYNGSLFVDSCQICEKRNSVQLHVGVLDVHHINFQCNCNENGFVIGKSYLPMNSKSNLIVLCKECHHNVHHGKLNIKGYKDTSNGRIVDYEHINDKNLITKKIVNKKISK